MSLFLRVCITDRSSFVKLFIEVCRLPAPRVNLLSYILMSDFFYHGLLIFGFIIQYFIKEFLRFYFLSK